MFWEFFSIFFFISNNILLNRRLLHIHNDEHKGTKKLRRITQESKWALELINEITMSITKCQDHSNKVQNNKVFNWSRGYSMSSKVKFVWCVLPPQENDESVCCVSVPSFFFFFPFSPKPSQPKNLESWLCFARLASSMARGSHNPRPPMSIYKDPKTIATHNHQQQKTDNLEREREREREGGREGGREDWKQRRKYIKDVFNLGVHIVKFR